MRCTVLLFAQARDAAGNDRVALQLPDTATVADAMTLLVEKSPALAPLRHRLAIAVDERYARPETRLRDGCTLAIIPPVSGG